jgi:hypothetical protein
VSDEHEPMGHRLLAVPDPLWDELVAYLRTRDFLVGAIPGTEDEDGRGTYIISPSDERFPRTPDAGKQ